MKHPLIGQRVVVRAPGSGVFIGTLDREKVLGNGLARIVLRDAQRVWKWSAGALETCHLAAQGPTEATISAVAPSAIIHDAREIFEISEDADRKIRAMAVWRG